MGCERRLRYSLRLALGFGLLCIFSSGWAGLAASQQETPKVPPGASGKETSPQPDKAKAYYHFSLSHLYKERGSLFQRSDLLAMAIDELKLALQYDPTSTFLSTELADLYASTGRWENALQEAEGALRSNPDDRVARGLLGRLYVRLLTGDRPFRTPDLQERAVRQFEEIVKRDPNDVSSYLVLAHLYRAGGDRTKAEEMLRKAIALQPDSEDANADLAFLYLDTGDYRTAIGLLEKVRTRRADVRILSALAYSYEQVRDYKTAASVYSQCLELDPDNLNFRKALGQNLLQSRQYDAAREQFEFLLHANPRDAEPLLRLSQLYRTQRKYDLARQNLEKALELAPDNLDVQYNQVLLSEAEGHLAEAIRLTGKILDSSAKADATQYTAQEKSNRGVFLEKWGFLYRDQSDFEEAEKAFRQMLELGGENAIRAEVRLIETYQEKREYDKALAASEQALRRYPESREVATTRAALLASMGEVDKGVQLLKPLLHNTSEDREIWLALAQVHLRAKQFEPALEAVAAAEKFSEADEEKSYTHFLYGSVWERQKQYERAEAEFKKALEIHPDSAMTLNYLGYMLAEQGVRLEQAIEYIQRALELEPNSGAYLDSLGWAYYQQNRLDLAEQYLKQAVEKMRTDPTIRAHLGDIYYKSGRIQEAQAEWQTALEEWRRLPRNEVDSEEVAKIEKKLKEANIKLAQENKQPRP